MSDILENEDKKKSRKKLLSDFEIARTILTRVHERKLPFVLKDMGEDPDLLCLCSCNEEEFTYGNPEMSFALYQFEDDDLKLKIDSIFNKIYGFNLTCKTERVINLKDQISELAKTKGESLVIHGGELHQNDYGSVWVVKKDKNDKARIISYVSAIESLFHMKLVSHWSTLYKPLLSGYDPQNLYVPYKHPDKSPTASLVTIDRDYLQNHPLERYFPDGFRNLMTKGLDVLVDKFLENFPYPVISQEMILFKNDVAVCQFVHRIIAQGWRMILVRPHSVIFPTNKIHLSTNESQNL